VQAVKHTPGNCSSISRHKRAHFEDRPISVVSDALALASPWTGRGSAHSSMAASAVEDAAGRTDGRCAAAQIHRFSERSDLCTPAAATSSPAFCALARRLHATLPPSIHPGFRLPRAGGVYQVPRHPVFLLVSQHPTDTRAHSLGRDLACDIRVCVTAWISDTRAHRRNATINSMLAHLKGDRRRRGRLLPIALAQIIL
jgi:hypothetical protein